MEGVIEDYFDHLPNDLIRIIFSSISDCKSLVRCMAVSKSFRCRASQVASLSIVCPGGFTTYREKLQKILSMVKGFEDLHSLIVRVGEAKEEGGGQLWPRCMRYAEIGTSVEKFIFMAAKSGDFSRFDTTAESKCSKETRMESEIPEFNLRQVIAQNNDLVKRMLPIIHFSILQGLTELRDSLPLFISRFLKLRRLVLVDMAESITFHLRDYHIQEMRAAFKEEDGSNRIDRKGKGKGKQKLDCSESDPECLSEKLRKGLDKGKGLMADSLWDNTPESSVSCSGQKGESIEIDEGFDRSNHGLLNEENEDGHPLHLDGKGKQKLDCSESDHECLSEKPRKGLDKGKGLMSNSFWESSASSNVRKGEIIEEDEGSDQSNHELLKEENDDDHLLHLDRKGKQKLDRSASSNDRKGESIEEDEGLDRSNHGLLKEENEEDDHLLHLKYAEGWDGQGEDIQGCYHRCRICRFLRSHGDRSKHVRREIGIKHSFKRSSKGENCKLRENVRENIRSLNINGRRKDESFDAVNEGKISSEDGESSNGSSRKVEQLICRSDYVWKTEEGRLDFIYKEDIETNFTDAVEMKSNNGYDVVNNGKMSSEDGESSSGPSRKEEMLVCRSDYLWKTEEGRLDSTNFSDVVEMRSNNGLYDAVNDGKISSEGRASSSLLSGIDSETGEGDVDTEAKNGSYMSLASEPDNPRLVSSFKTDESKLNCNSDAVHRESMITQEQSSQPINPYPPFQRVEQNCRKHRNESRLHAHLPRSWRDIGRRGGESSRSRSRDSAREELRRQQRDLEREVLSFDYTFWRSEKAATRDYCLFDVSMCIATQSAQPLSKAELEMLTSAALAGPLLATTVSHVNSQYATHNL